MTAAIQRFDLNNVAVSHLQSKNCLNKFSCGETEIDRWASNKSQKFHTKGRARVFIARSKDNNSTLGFYSLSFSLENTSKLAAQDDRDYWKDGAPLVYIDYLAVIRPLQGKGIGQFLLVDALLRAKMVFENVAVYGVALRSLNERTTELYSKFGFGIAPNEGAHPLMILPIWTLIDLFYPPANK